MYKYNTWRFLGYVKWRSMKRIKKIASNSPFVNNGKELP